MTVVLFEERVRIHVMVKLVVCVTTIITTFGTECRSSYNIRDRGFTLIVQLCRLYV